MPQLFHPIVDFKYYGFRNALFRESLHTVGLDVVVAPRWWLPASFWRW